MKRTNRFNCARTNGARLATSSSSGGPPPPGSRTRSPWKSAILFYYVLIPFQLRLMNCEWNNCVARIVIRSDMKADIERQ